MTIDGHEMNDHCGTNTATEKLLKAYRKSGEHSKEWEAKAAKLGARFANWRDGKWQSLYLESGLDKLKLLGYRVINAI